MKCVGVFLGETREVEIGVVSKMGWLHEKQRGEFLERGNSAVAMSLVT